MNNFFFVTTKFPTVQNCPKKRKNVISLNWVKMPMGLALNSASGSLSYFFENMNVVSKKATWKYGLKFFWNIIWHQ